jgi:hypothetical protein
MQEQVSTAPEAIGDDKLRVGDGVAHVVQELVWTTRCSKQIEHREKAKRKRGDTPTIATLPALA